jgi:oligopeptide transport system permease protein
MRTQWWEQFKSQKVALGAFYFIGFMSFLAVFAPLVTGISFEIQSLDRVLLSPNHINWFGTDELGRDLYSRVIYGARVSMAVGVLTSLIAVFIGTLYGAVAGYIGGSIDSLMMRVVDILQSIPPLILMILVLVFFNSIEVFENHQLRSIMGILCALSLVGWVGIARLVRTQVLVVREMPFIEAARALGAKDHRIVGRHIFPHILGPLLVLLTFLIPAQVLYESFLSFIGLGLQPPYSSWGVLAHEGWRSLRTYPHLIIFPGLAIFLTMLAFNFVGEGLRDALDPQLRFEPK